MGARADREGYWSLAAAVIASAIRDLQLVDRHSRAHRQSRRHRHSAERFFHETTSPRLHLWCAWLNLDPARVCTAVTTTHGPRAVSHRMADLMRRSR